MEMKSPFHYVDNNRNKILEIQKRKIPFGVSFDIYKIKNFFNGRINIILELSVVYQSPQKFPAEHA